MEWAFRNFENKTIAKKGEAVDKAKVWLGTAGEVSLVPREDITVVLPVARRSDMKLTVSYEGPLKAPVKKGDPVARLRIEIPDQQPLETDLLAGEDVGRQGAFARAKSRAEYLLTGTF